MQYQLAPLFCRPWTLNGMTPRLIESHYEGNYGGALKRLNAVAAELAALDPSTAPVETINRLKRDEAAALNSTLLHELYFASLGGDGRAVPDTMAAALARDFGSVDRWRKEFIALAEGLAGGSGWVLLTWLPRDARLINQVGTDHSQSLAGGIPILAIDMYEHAYHLDFGANASAYVAAFMRNIDWTTTEGRYEDAVEVVPPRKLVQKAFADVPAVSPEGVKAMLDAGEGVQVIDTRPRHYTTRASDIMEGAVWRDPERVDDWIGELSREKPVVTYCVYGFHIGCETAITLRKAGFDARYMAGGHYGWKAIGGKVRLFKPRRLLPFVIGGLIGIPLGVELLHLVPAASMRTAIGGFLVVFSLYSLFRPALAPLTGERPLADGSIGVLSGIIGGATGLATILPTIWSTLRGWPKDEQRAVFQPVGVALFVATAIWLGGTGTVDGAALRYFLIGLPAVLVGTWAGLRLYGRLDEAAFRKVVLVVLLLSGLALTVPHLAAF